MDQNECNTLIPAARSSSGKSSREILDSINAAGDAFGEAVNTRFGGRGNGDAEWERENYWYIRSTGQLKLIFQIK